VPINTISFVNIPPSQGNQVSAMVNLCRNLGGSIGISAFSTILARRAQVHQTYLAAHTAGAAFAARVSGATDVFFRAGSSMSDAAMQANRQIYGGMLQQATALAYIDVIRLFALGCAIALPLVFLAHRGRRGGGPAMAH
jgi:DHA2 family multidrug resistance protein